MFSDIARDGIHDKNRIHLGGALLPALFLHVFVFLEVYLITASCSLNLYLLLSEFAVQKLD